MKAERRLDGETAQVGQSELVSLGVAQVRSERKLVSVPQKALGHRRDGRHWSLLDKRKRDESMRVFIHGIDATVTLEDDERVTLEDRLGDMTQAQVIELIEENFSYIYDVTPHGERYLVNVLINAPDFMTMSDDDVIDQCAVKLNDLGLSHDLCALIKDVTDEGDNTYRIKTRERS